MIPDYKKTELPSSYQTFIALSRYARWLEDKQRRENWGETVDRYIENVVFRRVVDLDKTFSAQSIIYDLAESIKNLEVMPSMRALMTAGMALDRDNVAGYNCSYIPVDSIISFDEAMLILSDGTGVGYSVEEENIIKLPPVADAFIEAKDTVIKIHDNKESWAYGLRQLLHLLWAGIIPSWDTSEVRPAGAPLKTFGGRASGPEPLIDLFNFCVCVLKAARGRRLTSVECHDIMCKIAQVIVVGGVRRSAMISLSNLDDNGMRLAKVGEWWDLNRQRALANNSVAYNERPSKEEFDEEWEALKNSGSGERGIFSREAAHKVVSRNGRRVNSTVDDSGVVVLIPFGTNPCSEIILRPYQFCNLSEVIVRATDTEEDLANKVRKATILGTIQSTFTYFPYLRDIWRKNTEEERLLGVSFSGIMDNPLMTLDNKELDALLQRLKQVAIDTNAEWADALGIPRAAAITCVKPSGTVSQLVNAASGIHARHSRFYLRTVRNDMKDPITKLMIDEGVYWEPDLTSPETTAVFYFPMETPEDAVFREDLSAIDHLKLWMAYQKNWCEHKPSITVYIEENEWEEVKEFVWDNFDWISGVSFLPYDGGTYRQAPYQEIDEDTYRWWKEHRDKVVNWDRLPEFEKEDMTTGSKELACTAGQCEI